MRIYGKLNQEPRIESFNFDKKDDTGQSDGKHIIYGFEYSPCKFSLNDILFLKIVGVEGTSNYTLNVNFNYLPEYKVICSSGVNPPASLHYGAISTPKGMFLFNLTNRYRSIWRKI